MKWTEEQSEAIYKDGKDILVSAAAGSGKTAVLVERIIQKVVSEKNPINIDELFVSTFTNAAAEEMRSRIGSRLERELEVRPESKHLKKQISLLQQASISTLHAFCMKVVRENAYLIDLDPSFTLSDEIETAILQEETLNEMFEAWYGKEDGEEALFFDVVNRFSSDRNDMEVGELILDLYTFAMQNPWPEKWLNAVLALYDVNEATDEASLPWLNILKEEYQDTILSMQSKIEEALKIIHDFDGPSHYLEAIEADKQIAETALNQKTWHEMYNFMQTVKFKRLSGKRIECDVNKREQVKTIRKIYQDQIKEMQEGWFSKPLNRHLLDLQHLYPVIETVIQLVLEFKERFTVKKREKALLDFSDLEHLSLEILIDKSEPERLKASEVAESYQKKFTEVLVDEYQDINHVQETILSLVSRGHNMFMVGDVKQSIYRFRHADPTLFINKYKAYEQSDESGYRIDLARNFRSRKDVLTGTNYIFRQILDEAVGEIDYDETAELIYANTSFDDYPFEGGVDLLLIDRDDEAYEKSEAHDLTKAQIEARAYAKKIKEWMGHGKAEPLQVIDKETNVQRPVQYRDIVILQRSKTDVPTIYEEFKKQNIPVYGELRDGYFQAIEIQVMLSLLKVIDNPYQDIPLASVLRSPIVGVDEEELVQIKLENARTFYESVVSYSKKDTALAKQLGNFLKQLDQFKELAIQGELSELIWEIYRETGYFDFVGGIPGGRQRQANLRALYDRARYYETASYRGLFRFLRFIERMEELNKDLGTAPALSEQEDVVRILSIHQSKGLEFPIVIVGNINKEFNLRDLSRKYLLDKDAGFASKFIDPEKRITYATLYYKAMQIAMRRKLIAEEMRVLYVAMTRAKEKLLLVGNVNSLEKSVENWHGSIEEKEWILPNYTRKKGKSYLDWIGHALIRHKDSGLLRETSEFECLGNQVNFDQSAWSIEVMHGRELHFEEKTKQIELKELQTKVKNWEVIDSDSKLDAYVSERLEFEYDFKELVNTRAKQSVTEVKRHQELEDELSSKQFIQPFRAPIAKRPNFLLEKKTLTPAEKGTVLHAVMQYIPLTHPLTKEELKGYTQEMIDKELLLTEEVATLDYDKILAFFKTEFAEKIFKSSHLKKEMPFMFRKDHVIVQGIIDLLFNYEGNWYLVDYKTDYIKEEITDALERKLKERYEVQLQLYQEAIERILKEKVSGAYLYFLDKQLAIKVND